MVDHITPKDVIKIIEATINFLDINLVEDNLSPSSEMERQETVDRLYKLVENLTSVKSFTLSNDDIKVAKKSKDPPAVITKQPCAPVEVSTLPIVETLRSKLKVLTKWSPAELKEHAEHSGVLRKYKKQLLSKWNRRFCVLRDGILFYFQSETDTKGKGYIILGGYKCIIPPNSNGFTFNLESCDKSTIYTFQADHKKEIDIWKEHLLKVTDQGYTDEESQAINLVVKEILCSTAETNDDTAPPGDDYYGDVATPPQAEDYYGDVAPPPPEDYYGDVAAPETVEYYGDVAPPSTLPAVPPVEYYGDVAAVQVPVQPSDDDYYGDVAAPSVQPGEVITEELYEELPDGNADIGTTPFTLPHVPSKLPGAEEFSTENVYMGAYDCTGDDPQELSFYRGDVMYILEKIDLNWWMGFLNGKVGLVPSNFLIEAFAT